MVEHKYPSPPLASEIITEGCRQKQIEPYRNKVEIQYQRGSWGK